MAERVKVAYGEFCSRHNEAMQFYKDLLKSDSAFQAFIKVSLNIHIQLWKRFQAILQSNILDLFSAILRFVKGSNTQIHDIV